MSNQDHTQVSLRIKESILENSEIASAFLTSIGYVGFVEENEKLLAYIPVDDYDSTALEVLIQDLTEKNIVEREIEIQVIEDRNWNEVWEQHYFQPIAIQDRLYVRGSFHKRDKSFEDEIIIDPKMSFGTGHHQTTKMMLESLLEADLKNKSVMDMGTGTGILAIYAAKAGAVDIESVDIDDWSVENAVENFELNGLKDKIKIHKGDARILKTLNKSFDVFIANINLGVLIDDMQIYCEYINQGGELFLSGFLQSDIPAIKAACPLRLADIKKDGDWSMLKFMKTN
ncbi:MAG: 50S ribosomal protein L11 methyltransferase [Bacteroidetes bacterium]|nr:50S ribosomal protein L11 methyltransferase [Bacteroidota bacterium]